MGIDILGIDLARQVFQLHGADRRDYAQHGAQLTRSISPRHTPPLFYPMDKLASGAHAKTHAGKLSIDSPK